MKKQKLSSAVEQIVDITALVKQGAEARLYDGMFMGKRVIAKERFSKSYRIPELDKKLTRERLVEEARTLAKLIKNGIDVPCLYHVNMDCATIVMEYIDGMTLKDFIITISQSCLSHERSRQWIIDEVGSLLARLHDSNIVHGDLTTSNIMIRQQCLSELKGQLTLIDFGLSSTSTMAEDRAVDLYVLERAFQSTHPNCSDLFCDILKKYFETTCRRKETERKLEEVRMRGRKRDMTG